MSAALRNGQAIRFLPREYSLFLKDSSELRPNMSQMALASSRFLAATPKNSPNPTKLCASPWYPHGMANLFRLCWACRDDYYMAISK